MKEIQSNFIVKGYKNGNCYYIVKTDDVAYNVYQQTDPDENFTVKDYKSVLPSLKSLPDEEMIVSMPKEDCTAFLMLNHIDIQKMNLFRIGLKEEEILVNS
ncbi:hypothetical protein HF394_19675 (plasmid) [Planococcus glaciei]|uniref:Uncharacterized protein n=1 Tax=Planococcus glaciei TaxID=459472 RepID=A0A7H8QFW4_9BACL|nr:hypothetical protein [Planococcus glaciei]QDY46973.1 hypothetical protein FK545_20500 [Planococcus glaciei]QKX52850.1 hypothetical protein HF394_19675 [Planococcus glaciei]